MRASERGPRRVAVGSERLWRVQKRSSDARVDEDVSRSRTDPLESRLAAAPLALLAVLQERSGDAGWIRDFDAAMPRTPRTELSLSLAQARVDEGQPGPASDMEEERARMQRDGGDDTLDRLPAHRRPLVLPAGAYTVLPIVEAASLPPITLSNAATVDNEGPLTPFFVRLADIQPIGWLRSVVVDALRADNAAMSKMRSDPCFAFADDGSRCAWSEAINEGGVDSRTEHMDRLVRGWHQRGLFNDQLGGWRDEVRRRQRTCADVSGLRDMGAERRVDRPATRRQHLLLLRARRLLTLLLRNVRRPYDRFAAALAVRADCRRLHTRRRDGRDVDLGRATVQDEADLAQRARSDRRRRHRGQGLAARVGRA